MTTLILLVAMAYVILGVAKLAYAGFVREFNNAWAEAFSDQQLSVLDAMALVLLMLFMLLWCWLVWPFVLAKYRREQAAEIEQPWSV